MASASSLRGNCFQKIIQIYKGVRPIDHIGELKRTFPVSENSRELLASYTQEEQKRIFDFFSSIKYPRILSSSGIPFRKRSIRRVVSILIEHKADLSPLFEQSLRHYNRMDRHQKRALHLMLSKKWWFEGIPLWRRERPDLSAGMNTLFTLGKPSYWLQRYGLIEPSAIPRFLEDTVPISLRKKISRRFPYIKKFEEVFKGHPQAHRLKKLIDDLHTQKSKELSSVAKTLDKRAQRRLGEDIEHLSNLKKILAGEDLERNQWPPLRKVGVLLGRQVEDLATIFLSFYLLEKGIVGSRWLLSEYLSIENEVVDVETQKRWQERFEALPRPISESKIEEEENEIEALLRFCNEGQNFSSPQCRELL